MKYSFSGHETFACKQHWLKKGIDYLQRGRSFSDEAAVVHLGVGKNMVTSIRHWIKAFGLLDDQDQPTPLANFLFGENGADIYLEDTLTLWLMHYQLIKQQKSSIYSLVFNQFRRERQDFTKEQLTRFLERKIVENQDTVSPATLGNDVKVFLNNYLSTNPSDVEEGYTNILQELDLISRFVLLDDHGHKQEVYRFNMGKKVDLPLAALLYIILNQDEESNSYSLADLANGKSSPGTVFLLSEHALSDILKEIPSEFAVFTETAGNPVLQLRDGLDKWDILRQHYEN